MRLLLDSHSFIWLVQGNPLLGQEARAAIGDERNPVHVSLATAWELAIKAGKGKLKDYVSEMGSLLDIHGCVMLDVKLSHAIRSGFLPWHHKDPFDRMLVAQAQLEGLTIVTRDPNVRTYDVPVLPA